VKTGRPTTLKDVAREAGVSAMAVSNVLNNRGRVSEETRAIILTAVEKLNYTPNRVAQSLRSARTHTIGVVMSDSSQYVFANLLRGIESAASAEGYSVLLANTSQNQSAETKKIGLLASKRIDGLLLAAPMGTERENIDYLRSLQIPFVLLMRSTEFKDVNYVVNDNRTGGYISVKHLYESGERDFIFISLNSSSGRERMTGYQRCLSEYGLKLEDCYLDKVSPQIADGYEAMRRAIAAGHRQGAVCCGCDMIAIGAMNAILEAGLRIPGDFRLIGYDDFELTQYLRVPLSTVRQPVYQIGAEGVRLLLERISSDGSIPDQAVILQSELIVRQSSVRL
jgi:DNA-binding LacI/PurR family transcriptional regulator